VRLPAAGLVACALLSVLRRNAYKSDPIHPNADGEKIMTDNVYKVLQPMLVR